MKLLFVVQGEGRGHLTQAIALHDMLIRNGHQVAGVLVGKSEHRVLPPFFSKAIQAPIQQFYSPNFLPAVKSKKPNIWKSVIYNILKSEIYFRSIRFIRKQIEELEVDLVINFYDLLLGLTYALIPPKVPFVSIAHQYALLHPDFMFPDENPIELEGLKFFTKITCINASRLLALSMYPMEPCRKLNITVVPPLLRKEVLELQPSQGDFIHGYLLNPNYADDIILFQQAHPETAFHFFWDKREAAETTVINDHLSFHQLNDTLFLEYLARCKAYATTAGFESVCEAMYFGKPVLMVPAHIEQACNAFDAARTGAGIVSDRFDLQALIDYIPRHTPNNTFPAWVKGSEQCILQALFPED